MPNYSTQFLKSNGFLNIDVDKSRNVLTGPIEERFLERGRQNDLSFPQLTELLASLLQKTGRSKYKFFSLRKAQKLLNPTTSKTNDWNLCLAMEFAMMILFKEKYEPNYSHKKVLTYDPRIEEPDRLIQLGIPPYQVETTFNQRPMLASSLIVKFDDYLFEGDCYPVMYLLLRSRTGINYPGSLSSPGGHVEDITEATAWEEFTEENRALDEGWPSLDYGQVSFIKFLGVVDQVLVGTEGSLNRYINYAFCMDCSNFDFQRWRFTQKVPIDDGDSMGKWNLIEMIELDDNKDKLSPLMKTVYKEIPW